MYRILVSHGHRLFAFLLRLLEMPFRFRFPWKYWSPKVVSQKYPGKKMKMCLNAVSPFTKDAQTIQFFINYKKSRGNYFCDVDNNIMLDFDAQRGTLPLGYNDKQFVRLLKKGWLDTTQIQNTSMYLFPQPEIHEIIHKEIVKKAAPKGMSKVIFTENTQGLDLAVKIGLLNANNKDAQFAVFEGSSHGSISFAASALSRNAEDKLGGFKFGGVTLPFPKLQLPYDLHIAENAAAERMSLENISDILQKRKDIAGVLVEPLRAKDYLQPSPEYFRSLRNMLKSQLLIVDETYTGCGATGELWAHQKWNLLTPPDVLIFGGKCQAYGVFMNDSLNLASEWDLFENPMGSPLHVHMFSQVLKAIKKRELLNNVNEVSSYLFRGLSDISLKTVDALRNIRGQGLLVAFDYDNSKCGDLHHQLLLKGINTFNLSPNSIALHPSLTLSCRDVDHLLNALESILIHTHQQLHTS